MAEEATLKLYRGDDKSGELVDYTVPLAPGMVVLDAIHAIHQSPRLRGPSTTAQGGPCKSASPKAGVCDPLALLVLVHLVLLVLLVVICIIP